MNRSGGKNEVQSVQRFGSICLNIFEGVGRIGGGMDWHQPVNTSGKVIGGESLSFRLIHYILHTTHRINILWQGILDE
jgi:hypothetical protein